MAADFYYPTSKNAVQKELDAQLLLSATTGDPITLPDVDGVQDKPGVLVINRVDSNGVATPSSREYISYSGRSGNTVIIETRNVDGGGSIRTHGVGSIVEFIPDAVWAQRVIDQFKVEHGADGTHSSIIVKTTATQTLTNKTLTSPKIDTAILDSNGNEVIKTPATASAVNEITVTNAATGNSPTLSATGDDTNIGLKIKAKGSGAVALGTAELKVPNSDGSANQVLKTDGSGNLGFATVGGKVLQVVMGTTTTSTTINSGTATDTTLTASITPSSSSNKVLVMVTHGDTSTESADSAFEFRLKRDSTTIQTFAGFSYRSNDTGNTGLEPMIMPGPSTIYLDSPATTSATTYKTQALRSAGSGNLIVQKNNITSTIILMEIAA